MGGAVLLVLSLLYLADLNSERFYLTIENGTLVFKGLFFPVGKMDFHPNVAYQPFELPNSYQRFPRTL